MPDITTAIIMYGVGGYVPAAIGSTDNGVIQGVVRIPPHEQVILHALRRHERSHMDELPRVAKTCYEVATLHGYTGWQRDAIVRAGLLHDVGKLGVPASILTSPEKLTREQWEIVRDHPRFGWALVDPRYKGVDDEYLTGRGIQKPLLDCPLLDDPTDLTDLLPAPFRYHYDKPENLVYPTGMGDLQSLVGWLIDSHHRFGKDPYYDTPMDVNRIAERWYFKQKYGEQFIDDALMIVQAVQLVDALASIRAYKDAWNTSEILAEITRKFASDPRPHVFALEALVCLNMFDSSRVKEQLGAMRRASEGFRLPRMDVPNN